MKKTRDFSENNLREWEDYEGQEYDWDKQEADEEELYAEEEEMEFDGVEEDQVYYENEEYDGEYDGEYAADYYGEEFDSDADSDYYEAEEAAGEDYYGFEEGIEEYDGLADMDGSGEYGYEAEEGYEEDAVYAAEPRAKGSRQQNVRQPKPEEGFFQKVSRIIRSMDTMDRVMVGTGVGVLILALITVSVFIGARTVEKQVSGFASVGTQLKDIDTIGEQGLLAVANAEIARLAAASLVDLDEPWGGYDESGYEREITVELNFTSIQKDLKVKFVNKRTGKLVSNVPFSVTVTDPDNKTSIWSDDDMDGIIYKTDIKPGDYKVAMEELTDSRYKDYIISTTVQTVEVKKDIDYKKVDVANEVKTESEINAAKEDTKKNETTVESALQDTVTWTASTMIPASYNEVAKSTIPNPETLALSKSFLRMGNLVKTEDEATDPNSSPGPEESSDSSGSSDSDSSSDSSGSSDSDSSSDSSSSSVPEESSSSSSSSGPEEPSSSSSPSGAEEPSSSSSSPEPEPTISVQVVGNNSVTGTVGATQSAAVAAQVNPSNVKCTYEIEQGNVAIAKASITQDGKISIQCIGEGTTTFKVIATAKGATANTSITVKVTKKTLTLDPSATVYIKTPAVITATLENAESNPAIKAASSDTNIATVSVNGQKITVTGVAAGSAIITVEYPDPDGGETLKASCAVTVKINPKEDKTNKLKDNAGRQVYVLENGNYREAVIADYYTASKFFLAGEAKYTGWQTIDGKVYFFKEDGTKVTGEQVIQGAKYTFASDGSMVTGSGIVGIDVSKWNGTIDWNAVKNSGISYVIIRCGYRGSAEGTLVVDPKYEANIKGAAAAGLKVGVYFFSQAINEVEAVEEASMVLEQVKNHKLSYPIFLDVEASGGRADSIDKTTRTAVCKAFCQTIQNSGYTAGVYANKTWFETKIDADSLSSYKIWLAQYASNPTYKGRYNMWQYRSTGSVSGISGSVDMNISYLGY